MKPKGQRHLYALDLIAALALTAVYVGFARMTSDDGQPAYTGPPWLGCLIAATVGLPIAVRRRWPLPVLVAVLTALATASLLDIPREPYAAAGLAAYLVGLAEPARRSVPALAVSLPVACGAVYLGEAVVTPAEDWQGAVGVAGLVLLVIGGSWGAGFTVRGRRAEGAREQRRRAERALDEERLRIARELHDIVSHNLSLIAVKAGVAGHVAEADPGEARAALKVIEETSRSALAEMRRTLGVLRTEGAPLGPVPDLDRIGSLAAEAHRAGVDVDLSVHATEGLAEGTQLTIYRIVQESLTNVVRHAAPTRCQVIVEANAREVRIDVADEGPPSVPGRTVRELPGGHGLLGMRERAMMYGGSFEAGPRPEGGFAVSVRLPVEGNQTT
ncbi:sensor histidine kinase [Streptomyces sp. AC550_RSS872]|uniref:sensor histidine kinase n=1 Tax=Streptomyces sp. AC550_RSS872 TaxID=2823689 RepID=UPI001C271B41|nr:sensor histidine kinase [Streptomyces sp. AC550_RSS872]